MLKKFLLIMAIIVLSGLVSTSGQAKTVYVKKGDTLWGISHVHMTTVANLKDWNHLHTNLIHPGDVLTVSPEASYTVKSGDTLWAISKAHHINLSQLMKRNSLTSDLIHPGLKLVIPNRSNTSTKKQKKLGKLSYSHSNLTVAVKSNNKIPRVIAPSKTDTHSGKVITVTATAYTPSCSGCSGITATGMNVKANPHAKVIAVDPSVIPLGSKVYIKGLGVYTAADTGGAIKGKRIDILMATNHAAFQFGKKHLTLKILN